MRKLLSTILLLSASLTIWGNPVTREQARQYAESYFGSLTHNSSVTVKSIEAVGQGTGFYYIINFYPQGWMILSGDDAASPLIGYSKTESFRAAQMPDNMKAYMEGCVKEIELAAKESIEKHPSWNNPIKHTTRAGDVIVEPLISINWDQTAPFNKYCPMGKTLVGCVAVGISQAMSVFQFPDRPQGSIYFQSADYGRLGLNFDEQKAYNWSQIMSGADNQDEAARLLMHAGMAVQMNYGEDGSGVPFSNLSRIVTALTTTFKYPNTVHLVRRDSYEEDWSQLLKNELNAGRPIIYSGLDSKQSEGHCWNIDGYDSDGIFHCNWGWGGTGNGYFALSGLRYGGSHFDSSHVAVIGVDPGNRPLRSIELSNYDIEEGLPAGAVVGKVTVNGEDVGQDLTVSVHGTYSKSQGGYQSVPFTFENGLLKTSEQLRTGKDWTVEISVNDAEGNILTQGFVINVTEVMDLSTATSITYDRTTQLFTLRTKNNVSYTLTGADGSTIGSGELSPLPQLDFYRSQLTAGVNKLTLTSPTESISINIKK